LSDDNIVSHPKRALRTEAKIERETAGNPEARRLQERIFNAVRAYAEFLENHGLIWEDRPGDEMPRLKAAALVVTYDWAYDYGTIDISLKDGALNRVYGVGVNPDPLGRDADPSSASNS
jgi:hypothetical protein